MPFHHNDERGQLTRDAPLLPADLARYDLSFFFSARCQVVSNLLCFLQLVGMAEVLLIAKKSGMDLEVFWHAIRGSAGNSFLWETAGITGAS